MRLAISVFPHPVGPIMRTLRGVTSFFILSDRNVRRMRLRIARDTARLADSWPTMWRERDATIWDGVWCWWSLLTALCFFVSSAIDSVVGSAVVVVVAAVGVSSCCSSVVEDPSEAVEEKEKRFPFCRNDLHFV